MSSNLPAKSTQSSLNDRLKRALNYLDNIRVTANICSTNFSWLSINKLKDIPLLDFDIICGTLPSVALDRAITEDVYQNTTESVITNIFPGPYVIRHVVNQLPQLNLPPGTLGDMINWKMKKKGEVSSQAKNFLARLDKATQSDDPVTTFLEEIPHERNVLKILITELNSIKTSVDDLYDLELIEERNTPIERLLTRTQAEKIKAISDRSFRSALKQLNNYRPNKERNNINDAMNVAIVVRMFNTSLNMEKRNRIVPFYISQTQDVLHLRGSERWLKLPRFQEPPKIFNNDMYLLLAYGLAWRSDYNISNMIDEANILAADCVSLSQHLKALIDELADTRGGEESFTDLSEYEISMLQHKSNIFVEQWRSLFQPVISAKSFDQAEYINVLLSPDIKELIASDSVKSIRKGIKSLTDNLRNYRHPLYDVIKLALEGSENKSVNMDETIQHLFTFIWGDNTGGLLAEPIPDAKPIETFDNSKLLTSHDLRLLVKLNSIDLPVLAINLHYDQKIPGSRTITVTWSHVSDIVVVWEQALLALSQLIDYKDARYEGNFFASHDTLTFEGDLKVTRDVPQRLLVGMGKINYFDIRSGQFTFYADIEPLDYVEMQAGFLFPVEVWSKNTREILIDMLEHTNQISLSEWYHRAIFTHIEKYVQLSSAKMTGMQK